MRSSFNFRLASQRCARRLRDHPTTNTKDEVRPSAKPAKLMAAARAGSTRHQDQSTGPAQWGMEPDPRIDLYGEPADIGSSRTTLSACISVGAPAA